MLWLWLKQRYAHLVLLPVRKPEKVKPTALRWQNPFKVAQVSQQYHTWTEASQRTEHPYWEFETPHKDLIGLILNVAPATLKENLVTDVAEAEDDPKKVYVSAKALPISGYLIGSKEVPQQEWAEIYRALWSKYREALKAERALGATEGEINAAVGYWFGLSGLEDEFLDTVKGRVLVGLGTAGTGDGGALIGHWVAVHALDRLSPVTLITLRDLYRRYLAESEDPDAQQKLEVLSKVKDAAHRVIQDVLFGVLEEAWTSPSWEVVRATMEAKGYDPKQFLKDLEVVATYIHEHDPQLLRAFGIEVHPKGKTDEPVELDDRHLKVGRFVINWETLKKRIYSGSGLRGDRAFMLDWVLQHTTRKENEILMTGQEKPFWELVGQKMPDDQLKDLRKAFREPLERPIPSPLKSIASDILHNLKDVTERDVEGVDDIKDRLEHFLDAEDWWEMLEGDEPALEDAFVAYLYRVAEMAYFINPQPKPQEPVLSTPTSHVTEMRSWL